MPSGLQGAIRGHAFDRGAPGFEDAAHVFNPRFVVLDLRNYPQAIGR